MKYKILLVIFNLLSFVSNLYAADYDYEVDGIYYKIVSNYLEVTKHPNGKYTGDIIIPSQLNIPNQPKNIRSIGKSAFSGSSITSITIPSSINWINDYAFRNSSIKSVTFEGRPSLGEYAFADCNNLKTLKLNNSTFGGHCFENCTALEKVEFVEGVEIIISDNMFSGCTMLKNIDFSNIKTFGSYSFANCQSLSYIDFPEHLRSIGRYAFQGCTGLKNINLKESCTFLCDGAFYGCSGLSKITIPNIPNIGYLVFVNCDNLKEVTLNIASLGNDKALFQTDISKKSNIETFIFGPECTTIRSPLIGFQKLKKVVIGENVDYIYNNVCNNCPVLSTIEWNAIKCRGELTQGGFVNCGNDEIELRIGNNVTSIPSKAFRWGKKIKSINFPSSVKIIESYAFEGCSDLTHISLPDNIESIGEGAFSFTSLEQITIPSGAKSIRSDAFDTSTIKKVIYNAIDCRLEKNALPHLGVTDVYFGYDVTRVPAYAFEGATKLKNVQFGFKMQEIGSYAFSNTAVEEIRLMLSISKIYEGAFYKCSKLKEITLDSNVEYIGSYAFNTCYSLNKLTCYALNPPKIDDSTFENINRNAVFNVPLSAMQKYLDHGVWRKYIKGNSSLQETSNEDLTISFENGKLITNMADDEFLEIYSISGNLVFKGSVGDLHHFNALPNSIYLIRNRRFNKKIISR